MSSAATMTSAPDSTVAGRPCRFLYTKRLTKAPKAKATTPIINKRVRFIMLCEDKQKRDPRRIRGGLPLYAAPVADPLLNRTGDVGENIVCVRSDQPNGANDDYKDDGQHHGVFCNILSFFV